MEGIVRTPEQEDDYYKNRGPIPPFRNEYGCIQDVVGYTSDDAVLGKLGILLTSACIDADAQESYNSQPTRSPYSLVSRVTD